MFDAKNETAPGHYGPSQTALLLLDFHSIFAHGFGCASAPGALKRAVNLRTWAKENKIHIIHGLVDLQRPPFPTCKDIGIFQNVIQTMQAGGGEESPDLVEQGSDEITFLRTPGHVSALKSPGLEDFLQKNGIKSLLIAGLSTSGCVLRTALEAADAEYVVTVISDACADPKQDHHDFLVENIYPNRGYVATVAEFQEGFGSTNKCT